MKNQFEELLERLAEEEGEREFLFDAREGTSLTYRAFLERVRELAGFLRKNGVQPGDRVLLFLDNSFFFAVSYFAVTFCHAAAVPVNTNLKWKELRYILEDTRAAGILIDEKYEAVLAEALPDGVAAAGTAGSGRRLGQSTPGGGIYVPLYGDGARDLPEGTAMLLYTSGTTGHPKGVILSFENLLAKTADIIEAHQLTARDRVLCVLPWFHINGLAITLLTPLVSRQAIVIGGKFSVSRFWEDVKRYRITWFSGVPTMYSHMLSRGIPDCGRHSGLRFARSASSALPGAVLEAFERMTGVPVIESYGITEGCAQITSNPLPPREHKTSSVGLPYGNQIKVVDVEGNEQPAGVSGEVWIRGKNVTCGYYHKPEETQKAFTGEWFHSGDIGYLDGDGYLFLNGRIKELINRAGEKFSPIEIDEVLYQLPQVELAAAVGVPDPVYGEEVVCFIKRRETGETEGDLSEADVIGWCGQHLAAYKVPRKVYFVEDLPQGGNGKIQRLKLVEIYQKMEDKIR